MDVFYYYNQEVILVILEPYGFPWILSGIYASTKSIDRDGCCGMRSPGCLCRVFKLL